MSRIMQHRSLVLALMGALLLTAVPMLTFAQDTTSTDTAGSIIGLFFSCFCWIIGLVIDIVLAWWVYNDAKKRGNPNAILWAILTFFFTLLGLLLYFVIGSNQGMGTPTMGGPPPAGPTNTVRY